MTCFTALAAKRLHAARPLARVVLINLMLIGFFWLGCTMGLQAQQPLGELSNNVLWKQAMRARPATAGLWLPESLPSGGKSANRTFLINRRLNSPPPPTPSKLVYSSFDAGLQRKQIFTINADGSGRTNLSNNGAYDDTNPVWSNDRGKIAFIRNGNLAVMSADGSSQLTLSSIYGDIYNWSPDNTRIAFVRWSYGTNPDLFLINIDGTGLTQITNTPVYENWMAWSPDGNKIAFAREKSIRTINPDGTNETLLWESSSYYPEYLTWSPNGQSLAMTTYFYGALTVMNADGTNETVLTSGVLPASNIRWSPDSTKIAYAKSEYTTGYVDDVYVVNVSGGTPVQITSHDPDSSSSEAKTKSLAWAPDGTDKIAYSYMTASGAGGSSDLYVMNSDGTSRTIIAQEPDETIKLRWSPKETTRPTVSITAPANNAVYAAGASLTINATAADSDGTISKVEFYKGNLKLGEDKTSPYSFTWTNAAPGIHSLVARAYDNNWAITDSTPVSVTVQAAANAAPTVSFTAPVNNATFTAPAMINLTATASDSDGTIAKVEFYQGAVKLGEDVSAPYELAWNNVAGGSYQLIAIATDNAGATAASIVNITVTAPAPTGNTGKLVYSSIASAGGKEQIFSLSADGTGRTNLSNSSTTDDLYPIVSPDASKIAFGRNWNLLVMNADGSSQTILTSAVYYTPVSWSPDSKQIVFKKADFQDNPDLFIINADGTGLTRLTSDGGQEEFPIWSPDGSKIAFARGNNVYTINPDGSNETLVWSGGYAPNWLAWSPNGQQLALTGWYTGGLAVINRDGSNQRVLVAGIQTHGDIAWSPDSTKLAYVASHYTTDWVDDVYVVNASGGAPTQITSYVPAASTSIKRLAWAPDGSNKIAYSYMVTPGTSGSSELYVMNADGTGAVKIGQETDEDVRLTWANLKPAVSITAPVNNASFTAGANVTINATASDPNGVIAKVEFYQGSIKLGEDTTAPYTFTWNGVLAGSYALTAKAVDNNGGTTTSSAINITVTASACFIQGTVRDSASAPLSNVEVRLTGAQTAKVLTDAGGNYSFNVASGGNYIVTPAKLGYLFTPVNRTFANVTATQTAQNFTGTASSFAISGQILNNLGAPLGNVTVNLTGSQQASATTNASGNYSFTNVPAGGDYVVTPAPAGYYGFAPQSRTFAYLSANQTAANFTGAETIISGRITESGTSSGIGGAEVFLIQSTGIALYTVTDSTGYYSHRVQPGFTYNVVPQKQGYVFSPPNRTATNISSSQVLNFSGVWNGTIKGIIVDGNGNGLPLISVNLTGSQTATVLTEIDDSPYRYAGRYSFNSVPRGGSYTVTPTSPNHRFTPASVTFTNVQADKIANFSAVPTYLISGRVADGGGAAIAGAMVALGGSGAGTQTTDSNGNYSFTGLSAGGIYTLTATKSNYFFNPASRNINLTGNSTGNNFTGSLGLAISGRVADSNGTGISAVTVALSGSLAKTATTDATGNYTFSGLTTGGNYWITPSKAGVGFNPQSNYVANLTANQTVNFVSGALGAVILNPTMDAYVRDGASAGINYGTATPLEVMTSATANDGNTRDAYFKYSLAQIQGTVGTVKLRVFASLSSAGSVATTAHGVSNTTWAETGGSGIKWSNKPALGAALNSVTVASTTDAWYEIDVTNYIKTELAAGRTTVTLALHNAAASTVNIRLNSREAATNKPELLIAPEAAVNTAPAVNAGPDQTVILPGAVALNAAAFDDTPPSTGLTYSWSKISGPGTVTFPAPTALDTTASFMIPGVYTLQLSTSDGSLSGSDQVQITVNAAPGTSVLTTTADAHVRDGSNVSTNYGTATALETRTDGVSNSGNNRDAYLKFDTTSVTLANIGAVKLQIYAAASAAGTINTSVYSVATTTWIETGAGSITWTNKPVAGTTALSSAIVDGMAYTWYELDVTNYVKSEKTAGRNVVSLALRNPSVTTPNIVINSKEAAGNRPQLVVTPPASTAPQIINFAPSFGAVGASVAVNGANFGATKGTSTITFNGVTGVPTTWSATAIVVPVPTGAATGPVVVTVGGVASNAVIFTVAAAETDTDADGLGDSWERMYFGNLAQTGAGDFDGDGITNLQEYQQGRNPTLHPMFDTGGTVNLKVYTPLDNLQ